MITWLEKNQVPQHLRGDYSGNKFRAESCTEVTIPMDAGLWSGGSRETYRHVRLSDGAMVDAVNHNEAPWGNRKERTIKLEPGFCVVKHIIFCGKDLGLAFYVHPDDVAKILPAPSVDLTENEKTVLWATCSFKSSYGGRDRYEMARENKSPYWQKDAPKFMSRDEWNAAKASLVASGHLSANGAITPKGRNAAPH